MIFLLFTSYILLIFLYHNFTISYNMTTNNLSVINVPITIENIKYNVKIEVEKVKVDEKKMELKMYNEISVDLIEKINSEYKNNVELLKEKINKIKDEDFKYELCDNLYGIVKNYYNQFGENENILLFLFDIVIDEDNCLEEYFNLRAGVGQYRVIKLLFDNDKYYNSEQCVIYEILNIPLINDCLSESETLELRNKAFCKFISKDYASEYDYVLKYFDIVNNYEKIKYNIVFYDFKVDVNNSNTKISKNALVKNDMYEILTNNNVYKLFEKVCEDGYSNIALRILKDEDEHNIIIKEPQYLNDKALQHALKNNMVDVVFEIAKMRQKYKKQ